MREWVEDPRGMSVLAPLYQLLNAQMSANFGGNEIGMDPIGFLMDSPVMSLLYFMGDAMTISPEELVDEWLAKVHATD